MMRNVRTARLAAGFRFAAHNALVLLAMFAVRLKSRANTNAPKTYPRSRMRGSELKGATLSAWRSRLVAPPSTGFKRSTRRADEGSRNQSLGPVRARGLPVHWYSIV